MAARRRSRRGGAGDPGARGAESIGWLLASSRQQRGLSADDVIRQAGIPAHYLKMIESNDYSLIADQLYLLPFLRRYAGFVGLDGEEIAMRFVREVQRSDNSASRMTEPMPVIKHRTRRWLGAMIIAAVLVAAGAAAVVISQRPGLVSTLLGH